MLRKDFFKFESTSELHKELTNILLLTTEDILISFIVIV